MAPVHHVVVFCFRDDVPTEKRKELSDKMLGLKDKCVRPTAADPSLKAAYIQSSAGGTDNSIENLQFGASHVYVVEFASEEDRRYYVEEDEVHKAFKEEVVPYLIIERSRIIDFTPGVFYH